MIGAAVRWTIQLTREQLEGALIQIGAYRERHTIEPFTPAAGGDPICSHDGIRVLARQGGGWRHDPDEVRDLDRATVGHDL